MKAMNLLGTYLLAETIKGVSPLISNQEAGPHFIVITGGQHIPIMLPQIEVSKEKPVPGQPMYDVEKIPEITKAHEEVVAYLKAF